MKANINHALHLMLSLVTGGLWLISWVAICIGKIMRPWRCEHCGWHKPDFSHTPAERPWPPIPGRPAHAPRIRPQRRGGLVAAESGPLQP